MSDAKNYTRRKSRVTGTPNGKRISVAIGFDPPLLEEIEFLAKRQDKSFAQKVRELCSQALENRRIHIVELTRDQYWDLLPGARFAGGTIRHAYTDDGKFWGEIELPEELAS